MARIDADPSLDTAKRATLKAELSAQLSDYVETGSEHVPASSLDRLTDRGTAHGIPATRVFLGEFGVIRPSQDTRGRIMPGADARIGTVAKQCRERSFQWAVWDLDTSFAIGFGHRGAADKITDDIAQALR